MRHHRRLWPWALALALAAGVCCAPASGVFRSTLFKFTGSEKSYRVPAGVTMLGVEAIGGFGAPNPFTVDNGMDLGVALPVPSGETLYAEVGQGATGAAATFGGGGGAGSSFFAAEATGNIFYQTASGQAPSVILAPLIAVTRPSGGAVFKRGQVVDAAYACLDTCTGTVPPGQPIDTATPGRDSFEVTEQAQSHHAAVSILHYTVR